MSEITCQNSCHDDNFCLLGDHPTCKYKQQMNQPNQPAPKSANLKRCDLCGIESDAGSTLFCCESCGSDGYFQKAPPKSAEEVALRINKFIHEQCIDGVPHDIEWNVMKQFARYVTDDEIDAMWPVNINMTDKGIAVQELQREAAKAMRDKIFNNVKPPTDGK